jgi:hypothetical protein
MMLGAAYHLGLGLPRDQAQAFRWLTRAATQGNEQASGFLNRVEPVISPAERAEAERLLAAGDSA